MRYGQHPHFHAPKELEREEDRERYEDKIRYYLGNDAARRHRWEGRRVLVCDAN